MKQIQTQEIGERLKRLLRLRGATAFNLDETVIPVAIAADQDREPFRTVPVTWSWPFSTVGDATHRGITAVRNPIGSGGIVVIRGGWLAGNIVGESLQWGVIRQESGSGVPAGASLTQSENRPFLGTNINTNDTQPLAKFANDPTLTIAMITLGQMVVSVVNGALPLLLINPIVLFPGDVFLIAPAAITQAANGYVEGEDYVPLP